MKRFARSILRTFSQGKKYPQVFSWGRGDKGRLGHNNKKTVPYPRSIPRNWFNDKNIVKVEAGGGHSFALTDGDGVFFGQLGVGDDLNTLGPMYVDNDLFRSFVDISCGEDHTLAVTKSGELYSWGKGGAIYSKSPLGHSSKRSRKTPKRLKISEEFKFVQCSAGVKHSAAVTESGEVFSWGEGSYGRLGNGKNRGCKLPEMIPPELFQDEVVVKVEVGESHSGALTESGRLFMFGRNDDYKLGVSSAASLVGGASFDAQTTPCLIDEFDKNGIIIKDFDVGEEHTAMVTIDGQAWFWGKNVIEPPLYHVASIEGAYSCSVGGNHLIFLGKEGAYVIGYTNWHGQMGVPEKELKNFNIKSLFQVDKNKFVPKKFVDVSCGDNYTLAILEE